MDTIVGARRLVYVAGRLVMSAACGRLESRKKYRAVCCEAGARIAFTFGCVQGVDTSASELDPKMTSEGSVFALRRMSSDASGTNDIFVASRGLS